VLLAGLMLAGAGVNPGLPDGYWNEPQSALADMPHGWSALETNLHPEACAQCHQEQFDVWKDSLHAQAYSSGMVGQFADMGVAGANDCLICHAPLKQQHYRNEADMLHSLTLKLKHPAGVDRAADVDAQALPLRHSGISCAVCHVRGWQRFGPPPRGSAQVGHLPGVAHGGFTATRAFEQSQFCASCHQFPASMAINGKPLENTLVEWKQSRFSTQGITCQQCHMPDRRHEFRGIHDPDMVRKGLAVQLIQRDHAAVFTMTSRWIGHAFPTYVTPKVVIAAQALNAAGDVLRDWQWEIVRQVEYQDGWQERRDTRLMPGESRDFVADNIPDETTHVRYRVRVIPDHFYKGVYTSLLAGSLEDVANRHITHAMHRADSDDYLLYEKTLQLRLQP